LGRLFGPRRFYNPFVREGDPDWDLKTIVLFMSLFRAMSLLFSVSVNLWLALGDDCGWIARGNLEDASLLELLKWTTHDVISSFFNIERAYP